MRLLKEQSGQAVVVSAAFMGLIALGFLALAVDAGSLFREKTMAQGAADAAALAAAEELSAGNSSNEQTVANAIAKLNGFDTTLATNPATVTLTTPSSGDFTGSSYVQAKVSRPIATIFWRAFAGQTATTVSAQAIAGESQSETCVCLESTSGDSLYMDNGAKINSQSCGVIDNSNASNAIVITGSTLNALSVGTVSTTWDNATNISAGGAVNSSNIVKGITSTCNPAMPPVPSYSTCYSDPGGTSTSFTAGPSSASGVICYTSLTLGANGTSDTLKPGTYVINGGYLTFESGANGHSNLGGDGVFFYLAGGASLTIDNGANVNLVAGGATESGGGTAPTVGVYNGYLLYQVSGDTVALTVAGGSTSYMNGALYAPSAQIDLSNGSGSTVTGGVVAKSLNMIGGAILNATSTTNEGSLGLGSAKLVQ